MKVELLCFDGCPGYEELLPRVRELVGDRCDVQLDPAHSLDEAERVGSPTLRVNGDEGQSRVPPDEWIRRALEGTE